MGYFSNGTEGDLYEEKWCKRCVHYPQTEYDECCMVWFAHLICNYDECNDEDSVLHMLIPREGIRNLECKMFIPRGES